MQKELRALGANFNIELIGVNQMTGASGNAAITFGRTLPWLQDTPSQNVWGSWAVTHRDLRIVDENNELVGVFNLTQNDLQDPSNRDTLKQMLLNAARALDADADKLPDAWETKFSRSNGIAPSFDLDLDKFNHFMEFAFGSDPSNANDKPVVAFSLNNAGRGVLQFKRWFGNLVTYAVESSNDLQSWQPISSTFVAHRNLFDKTGYFETTFTLEQSAWDEEIRFLRVRAIPQP